MINVINGLSAKENKLASKLIRGYCKYHNMPNISDMLDRIPDRFLKEYGRHFLDQLGELDEKLKAM